MARTPSTMRLPIGSPIPPFNLPAFDGTMKSHAECAGPAGLLVVFMCPHCPFVIHLRDTLAKKSAEWMARGVGVVAINSNDIEAYPQDAPAFMAQEAKEAGYTFPYLSDASQSVARAYSAACTPDFFLFDQDLSLAYCGRFDDSTPGNGVAPTGNELSAAIDAMLADPRGSIDTMEPSIGCNIKWKPSSTTSNTQTN